MDAFVKCFVHFHVFQVEDLKVIVSNMAASTAEQQMVEFVSTETFGFLLFFCFLFYV